MSNKKSYDEQYEPGKASRLRIIGDVPMQRRVKEPKYEGKRRKSQDDPPRAHRG